MPLINRTFSDIITFTRASTATYFDSAGVLQSAAIDVPRFDYNPATLEAQGLLIEEQRTNLLTYSEEFDDAAWTKGASTITAEAAVAPDGTTTADKIVEDATNAQHHVRQGTTVSSGATVTVSVFAKAAERTTMQLYMNDNSTTANRVQANFDLSTGTTSAASNFGTFTGATSSVTDVGNGWYRCVLTGVATGVTLVAERIAIGTTSYTGDGTSGIYIWGAQLEEGAFATSVIPTTSTAVTRAADAASVNTLSPWYNAAEGTLYVEFDLYDKINNQFYISLGTSSTRVLSAYNTTTNGSAFGVAGGSPASTTSTNKIAGAYTDNGATYATSVVFDGVVRGTGSPSTGTIDRLWIGRSYTSLPGNFGMHNGHIKRVTYYPRRLSQAELEAITS